MGGGGDRAGVRDRRGSGLTEEQFLARVTALCDWLHLLWYHTRDSRRSPSGFPDLVIVGPTRVIYAELKSEKGRTTARQKDWLAGLQAAGQAAHVWRPSDWEWVQQELFNLAGRRR